MYCKTAFILTEKEVFLCGPADGHEFAPRRQWLSLHCSSCVQVICGAELSMIDPTIEDVPNLEVKSLIEEVLNIADSKKK